MFDPVSPLWSWLLISSAIFCAVSVGCMIVQHFFPKKKARQEERSAAIINPEDYPPAA